MAKRLGVWSLRDVAHTMCRLITKFSPILRAAYPDNAALQAALSAAMAACEVLDAELAGVQEEGV